MRHLLFLLGVMACSLCAQAQKAEEPQRSRATMGRQDKQADVEMLKKAYDQQPGDRAVYENYLQALLLVKNHEEAERIVQQQLKFNGAQPDLLLDQIGLYVAMGKEKKVKEAFDKLLPLINGDDMLTQRIANKLQRLNRPDEAIKVYEQAITIMRNPSLYAVPLSKLYAANQRFSEAVWILLDGMSLYFDRTEDIESLLLEIINDETEKRTTAKKAILKRVQEQPANAQYGELLLWLYTQEGDWEGALIQVRALHLRNKENGQRLLQFAELARQHKQFTVAQKAVKIMLDDQRETPLQQAAQSARLYIGFEALQQQPSADSVELYTLIKAYREQLTSYPELYATPVPGQLATLLAQHAHLTEPAIEVLEKSIGQPTLSRPYRGRYKLQMGDYLVIAGKIWDASLTYSQVDKEFREDALGEEARFRNARLAYYRGDFDWAQAQLTVLKASTSELIANDALQLSVLITENITPDSNYIPLLRFAHADLLLFQNRYSEAIALYDSLAVHYPEHPLQDDILMQKAAIAERQEQPKQALALYQSVIEKYSTDVLADDALFKMAELYRRLHNTEKARQLYEQLILNYNGSTYVQEARRLLSTLSL